MTCVVNTYMFSKISMHISMYFSFLNWVFVILKFKIPSEKYFVRDIKPPKKPIFFSWSYWENFVEKIEENKTGFWGVWCHKQDKGHKKSLKISPFFPLFWRYSEPTNKDSGIIFVAFSQYLNFDNFLALTRQTILSTYLVSCVIQVRNSKVQNERILRQKTIKIYILSIFCLMQ